MSTILQQILADKKERVQARSRQRSLSSWMDELAAMPPARGFRAALQKKTSRGEAAVIAEIKKASPSQGLIRDPFDPVAIAVAYEQAGAACLSVLTEEAFFQGADLYLQQARAACTLPALRKDFVVDRYQIAETRGIGADAILLIVAALSLEQLGEYHAEAVELGLDVLVEVHNARELESALRINPDLLGINNRNLHTFDVSLNVTLALRQQVPQNCLLVTESGIRRPDDVVLMQAHGVHAFLVGESLMRQPDPGKALSQLIQRVP